MDALTDHTDLPTAWGPRETDWVTQEVWSQGQLWTWVFALFQKLSKFSHLFPFSTIGISKYKDKNSF